MEFTNNAGARLSVEVYNQTDRVTLVPRWSVTVEPGATVEYRPRAGDSRLYRAAVAVDGRADRRGKRWVEAIRDRGQSVEITAEGNDLVVSATLDPDHDLANWMGNLGAAIVDRDLRRIIVPGTHDSGSFSADMTPAVRTQNRDFDFQLRNGIRYFDLRVTFSTAQPALGFNKNTFYLCHNCVSARELDFETQLEAVAAFAEAHPREIILLDFHELTEGIVPYPVGGATAMGEGDRTALLALVKRSLGDRLVPLDADLRIGDRRIG